MTDTRLTFKEMCARFDVTPRTLRYYEYIELLQPEREGRSRFYHPREIARMELIMLYDTEGQNQAQMTAWIRLADGQLEELHTRKRQIDEAINELQHLRDRVERDLSKT